MLSVWGRRLGSNLSIFIFIFFLHIILAMSEFPPYSLTTTKLCSVRPASILDFCRDFSKVSKAVLSGIVDFKINLKNGEHTM